MWWIIIVGLVVGGLIGTTFPIAIPATFAHYISIALLAALDTALGGMRASLERRFSSITFVTGLFSNAVLAALLTYLGDKLGVQLYYAALFAFGFRIFQNLGAIRHLIIDRWIQTRAKLPQVPG